MWGIFQKKRLCDLKVTLPRDELVRRSRILIIDDERPDFIKDLTDAGFSVDHLPDVTTSSINKIERPLYDLILLDFGNVGTTLGEDQGLALLRHIKRVNPAAVVYSYTSKSLGTKHADFFRLSDGVLAKDAGIGDSIEKIEAGLRKAHSIDNVWAAFLAVAGVQPGSKEDEEWQDQMIRSLGSDKKQIAFKAKVTQFLGSEEVRKAGIGLLEKVVEMALKAYVGR